MYIYTFGRRASRPKQRFLGYMDLIGKTATFTIGLIKRVVHTKSLRPFGYVYTSTYIVYSRLSLEIVASTYVYPKPAKVHVSHQESFVELYDSIMLV